ncbi:MAG: 4Fe-4S dicluster domain-containing protein [Treponema sp.]|nr:4Fe-4S dicluster domain-containing protein [Treponema sp.]
MSQYGFYFDMQRCVGCRVCQIACKGKNGLALEATLLKVRTFESGVYPNPGIYHIPTTCNHCANPPCVPVCPVQAIEKLPSGIVDIDPDRCIGCRACIASCPYTAIHFIEEQAIAKKCDFCRDLVEDGGNPACVDACMTRSLHWGEMGELAARHPNAVKDVHPLPPSGLTNPSKLMSTRRAVYMQPIVEKQV